MNKFLQKIVSFVKIIIAIFFLLPGGGIFIAKNREELFYAIGVFVFVSLPTFFVLFLKKRTIARFPRFGRVWKFLRIIYAIVIILFLVAVGMSFQKKYENYRTEKAIERINAVKITIDDVRGKNLPPEPDKTLNDSTIAGIDANNNNIRDDVELEIFKRYPDSAKIRAAMLQYAQALQLGLTEVFNSETLVATIRKESSGGLCIGETGPQVSLSDNPEVIREAFAIIDNREKEVDDLVINTGLRKEKHLDNYEKYMTTYSLPTDQNCDIELSSLPN